MGEELSTLVPVRLTCRYTNGAVVSYGARALAYTESSLRVLSSVTFDVGLQLTLLAPFLEGIVQCRVKSASRSRKQPAYFELDLKFVKQPAIVARYEPDREAEQRKKAIPEEVILAGQNLAFGLEKGAGRSLSQVLDDAPSRPLALLVMVTGVLLVLQGKSLLDVKHLLVGCQAKGKAMKASRP